MDATRTHCSEEQWQKSTKQLPDQPRFGLEFVEHCSLLASIANVVTRKVLEFKAYTTSERIQWGS